MSCPRTTRRFLWYIHRQGRWAPFLYREWPGALIDRCLTRLFRQDHAFFLPGLANDLFHIADVQRDPSIPLFSLLAPHVSSPCLDANEEINLRAIGSLGCWSL